MTIHANLHGAKTTWVVLENMLRFLSIPLFLLYSSARSQPTPVDQFRRSICHMMCFPCKKVVWSPPPHIPHISSPNQCLLFATHAPYHRNLFCCSINTISSIPSISLNSLLGSLSFTLTLHIHSHLCSLKCHLIFFPDRLGLTSM